MFRKTFILAIVLTLSGMASAQSPKSVKLTGYLIDNMCASHHENNANFVEEVKEHSVSCAEMPNCEKSGFAVVAADGHLYKFDEAGNKSVSDVLKKTKTKKGLQVAVEGTLEGDTLHVTKIEEVTVAKS